MGYRDLLHLFLQFKESITLYLNFRREKMALIPWDDGVLARLVPGLTK